MDFEESWHIFGRVGQLDMLSIAEAFEKDTCLFRSLVRSYNNLFIHCKSIYNFDIVEEEPQYLLILLF